MNAYLKGWIFWALLTLGLFALLPTANWLFSAGSIPLTDTRRLFSLDLAHSHANRFLYRQGLSGNPRRVVVGRQGWLFLGNRYQQVLDKTQGIGNTQTSNESIDRSIEELLRRQRWLTAKGIMTLFVIAPNKHTVYPEFLPTEVLVPQANFSDDFVARAQVAGLHVLDLRKALQKAKSVSEPLYFKTDSHWNQYGAYLGYRDTLAALNNRYGAQMKRVEALEWHWIRKGGGDLARLLKFDILLDGDVDRDAELTYHGARKLLCLQQLSVEKLAPRGTCEQTENHRVSVSRNPLASFNQQALNRMNVLWLRDSFGDINSKLYQQTFSRLWQVHYGHFAEQDWQDMIEKLHPDLVLYQVVERALHEPVFQSSTLSLN